MVDRDLPEPSDGIVPVDTPLELPEHWQLPEIEKDTNMLLEASLVVIDSANRLAMFDRYAGQYLICAFSETGGSIGVLNMRVTESSEFFSVTHEHPLSGKFMYVSYSKDGHLRYDNSSVITVSHDLHGEICCDVGFNIPDDKAWGYGYDFTIYSGQLWTKGVAVNIKTETGDYRYITENDEGTVSLTTEILPNGKSIVIVTTSKDEPGVERVVRVPLQIDPTEMIEIFERIPKTPEELAASANPTEWLRLYQMFENQGVGVLYRHTKPPEAQDPVERLLE